MRAEFQLIIHRMDIHGDTKKFNNYDRRTIKASKYNIRGVIKK